MIQRTAITHATTGRRLPVQVTSHNIVKPYQKRQLNLECDLWIWRNGNLMFLSSSQRKKVHAVSACFCGAVHTGPAKEGMRWISGYH